MSTPYTGKNQLKDWDWVAVCDVCGHSYLGSTMKPRWDGAFVDDDCWEPYPEAYKSKVIHEDRSVPVTRPRVFDSDQNTLATTPPTSDTDLDGFFYTIE